MKYSLTWLKELVDLKEHPGRELLNILTNIGLTVETFEEKEDDLLFDLDLTTNRPDALSHLGVARELSVALRTPLHLPDWPFTPAEKSTKEMTSVTLEDPEGCPRYACRIYDNIHIGPSPSWLAERLESIGIRSINNVVDITNYVLAYCGQPLHAFDYEKLSGHRVVVRKARSGEQLTTLDGEKHALQTEDLVIADARRAVALAGIMGGEFSEITPSTRTVLLESAYFDPVTIRRTCRRMGLHTEASQRFSRGQDPDLPARALDIASHLFEKLDCGRPASDVVDNYPSPPSRPTFRVRKERIDQLLGIETDSEYVQNTLKALEMTVEPEEGGWSITSPSFRVDIENEIDVVEEIARHYGYDNIPSRMPEISLGTSRALPELSLEERLRDLLVSCGLTEVICYAFSDAAEAGREQPLISLSPVRILNPLSENASHLRTSLLPGLIRTCRENHSRGNQDLALFELGTVFGKGDNRYDAHLHAAILLTGRKPVGWKNKEVSYDFFDLKGIIEEVLGRLGVLEMNWQTFEIAGFESGRTGLTRWNGIPLACAGKHKEEEIYLAEIHLTPLLKTEKHSPAYLPYSPFPGVPIDLTFGHTKEVTYEQLIHAIRGSNPAYLKHIHLLDRFVLREEDKIKTTLRLLFQSGDRSLTQEEVNSERDKIVEHVVNELDVSFG